MDPNAGAEENQKGDGYGCWLILAILIGAGIATYFAVAKTADFPGADQIRTIAVQAQSIYYQIEKAGTENKTTPPKVVTPTPGINERSVPSVQRNIRPTASIREKRPPIVGENIAPTQPTKVVETRVKHPNPNHTTPMGSKIRVTVNGFRETALRSHQLIQAIDFLESRIGVAYPSPAVTMVRVKQLSGGFCGHNQMSYQSRYSHEPYRIESSTITLRIDDKCDKTYDSIAHEVAHTWFHGSAKWINEGLANSFERQAVIAANTGETIYLPQTHCADYQNIKELEAGKPARQVSSEAGGFSCNYRLGEGIFYDLEKHLGMVEFNQKVRTFAKQAVNDENQEYSINDLRQVFSEDPTALGIIKLWYEGNPETEPFRHLDAVKWSDPPITDGEYIHFAGHLKKPYKIHEIVIGKDEFCSQFNISTGIDDPDYIGSIADPLPVGWKHHELPKFVVINHEIDPAGGTFQVTARANATEYLELPHLSLVIDSRVQVGPENKCQNNVTFSQVKLQQGIIPDELKVRRHYHKDIVQWNGQPTLQGNILYFSGKAPPRSISFVDIDGYCSQFNLYTQDLWGYHLLGNISTLLPGNRFWNDPDAQLTWVETFSDGSFTATAEILDQTMLNSSPVLLRIREPSLEGVGSCRKSDTMGIVEISRR